MPDRYAVGTGTWNASNTAIWSATDGGATGASVPTSADNVYLTTNTGTITVGAAVACNRLTQSGGTLSGSSAITVSGSFIRSAGTWNHTGNVTFAATTTGKTIGSAGAVFGAQVVFNGVGGEWTLTDALSATGNVTLTNGSLKDGGFSLTCPLFISSNSNTRSITKTAQWTITGSGNCVNFSNAAGMTMSASGGFNLTDSSASARGFIGGGLAFGGTLKVSAGTGSFSITGVSTTLGGLDFTGFTGALTITTINVTGDVTLGAGMSVVDGGAGLSMIGSGLQKFKSNGVQFNRTMFPSGTGTVQLQDAYSSSTRGINVVSGTFDDAGYSSTMTSFICNTIANLRTCNLSGNMTLIGVNNVVLFNVTNLTLNIGSSQRFTVNNPTASDAAINTGGAAVNDLYVISGTYNLSLGTSALVGFHNVDFTGFKGTLSNANFRITGNMICDPGMVNGPANNAIRFVGNGSVQTLTTNGSVFARGVYVQEGAYLRLADHLDQTGDTLQCIHVDQGTFDMNGKNLTTAFVIAGNSPSTASRTLLGGSGGTWTLTAGGLDSSVGGGYPLQLGFTTNLTVDLSNTTILVTDTSGTRKDINVGGGSYGTIQIVGGAGAGSFAIQAVDSAAHIGSLIVQNPGTTIIFSIADTGHPAAVTEIDDPSGICGAAGNHNTITSNNTDWRAKLNLGGGGIASLAYVDAYGIDGGPGYSWFMGDHSTNLGNNIGVAFCSPANASMMKAIA